MTITAVTQLTTMTAATATTVIVDVLNVDDNMHRDVVIQQTKALALSFFLLLSPFLSLSRFLVFPVCTKVYCSRRNIQINSNLFKWEKNSFFRTVYILLLLYVFISFESNISTGRTRFHSS